MLNPAAESVSGFYLAKTPLQNKGISFSHEERQRLGLRGLFPAGEPISLEQKIETAMENFRGKVKVDMIAAVRMHDLVPSATSSLTYSSTNTTA